MTEASNKRVADRNAILRVSESRNCWGYCAPAEHSLQDVLQPNYLWQKARELRPGDQFEIRHARHAFLVKAYIIEIDRDAQAIAFKCLPGYPVDFRQMELVAVDWTGATVSQESPPHHWCVRLNGMIAKSDFSTEAKAAEWLRAKQELAAEGKSASEG